MSVRGRIVNAKNELSTAESKIANYILENPQATIKMTAAQLATVAGTSPASVIRLTKRLEIDSFTTLKILLSSDLTKDQANPSKEIDILAQEPFDSIKEKLLNNALQSIAETTDQVNESAVDSLVKAIIKATNVFVFGVGASYLTAQNIAQKWNRLGYATMADNDLNILLPKLVNANHDDLLWIISNSGESPEALAAAQFAESSGLTVAAVTQFGTNDLSKLAQIVVHTSQPKESPNRIAATNSLLAQFMLVDMIFYDFVSQTFTDSSKFLNKSHDLVKEYKEKFGK